MKKVEAIFRPEKLEDVREALDELERAGLTVIEVKGHGVQGGLSQQWRGGDYHVESRAQGDGHGDRPRP